MTIHPIPTAPTRPAPPRALGAPPPAQPTRPAADATPGQPGQPHWNQPIAPAAPRGEEATVVMPHRWPPLFAAPPQAPAAPPGFTRWAGPAYPPPALPATAGQRRWAWIAGAGAAVVAVTVGAGALIALAGHPETSAAHPAASSPPAVTSSANAPSDAPAPAIVALDALPALMLDAGAVNGIEGAADIRPVPDPNTAAAYTELATDKPECEGIQHPAQIDALRGSGYLGVQTESFQSDTHFIAHAAIAYPSAAAAAQFAAEQAQNWTKCNGKPLTLTTPAEGSTTFAVGTVTNSNGMLSVVFTQEGARGWACQRALTVRNNVVVDTRSCGFSRTDQAIKEAARIADRVSTG